MSEIQRLAYSEEGGWVGDPHGRLHFTRPFMGQKVLGRREPRTRKLFSSYCARGDVSPPMASKNIFGGSAYYLQAKTRCRYKLYCSIVVK
jgi:hypothetical protein